MATALRRAPNALKAGRRLAVCLAMGGKWIVPQCMATRRGRRCVRLVGHKGNHNPGRPGLADWSDAESDTVRAFLLRWVDGLRPDQAEAAAAAVMLVQAKPELGELLREELLRRQGFAVVSRERARGGQR